MSHLLEIFIALQLWASSSQDLTTSSRCSIDCTDLSRCASVNCLDDHTYIVSFSCKSTSYSNFCCVSPKCTAVCANKCNKDCTQNLCEDFTDVMVTTYEKYFDVVVHDGQIRGNISASDVPMNCGGTGGSCGDSNICRISFNNLPTRCNSKYPTRAATRLPTEFPTKYLTDAPTKAPTKYPTDAPTKYPTDAPTKYPTDAPTKYPTGAPTKYPTGAPTKYPTDAPTRYPTDAPTKYPTGAPTKYPIDAPTKYPTGAPTKYPTGAPTKYPTGAPTKYPTGAPTKYPSDASTKYPTDAPTKYPTDAPTKYPTGAPTKYPTDAPTKSPTDAPTKYPTNAPTAPTSCPPCQTWECDKYGDCMCMMSCCAQACLGGKCTNRTDLCDKCNATLPCPAETTCDDATGTGVCIPTALCNAGKNQICDDIYQSAVGGGSNRGKCCPATSSCLKAALQQSARSVCSTICGVQCYLNGSLSNEVPPEVNSKDFPKVYCQFGEVASTNVLDLPQCNTLAQLAANNTAFTCSSVDAVNTVCCNGNICSVATCDGPNPSNGNNC